MNALLFKTTVFQRRLKQIDIAKKIGCSESKISYAIYGYRNFTESEARKVSKILRLNMNDLFPEYSTES